MLPLTGAVYYVKKTSRPPGGKGKAGEQEHVCPIELSSLLLLPLPAPSFHFLLCSAPSSRIRENEAPGAPFVIENQFLRLNFVNNRLQV